MTPPDKRTLAAAGALALLCATATAEPCRGLWSSHGIAPYSAPGGKVPAPDGRAIILATDAGLTLTSTRTTRLATDVNPPLTEVVWSPDSRHLAINVSLGGEVGEWAPDIIDAATGQSVAAVLKAALRVAARLPRCDPAERPELAIVGWSADGRHALLAAEVPNHSTCRNLGRRVGYEVDISDGKVVATLTENAMRQAWAGFLGCRFAAAAD